MSDPQPTILAVDDDQDILDFFELVLETEGYQIVTAGTAGEGLEAFRSHHPDLVFVDLMMEDADSGKSLVKALKEAGNEVPIYMVTSVADSLNATTDHRALGLAGILQKPVDINHLLRLVKAALA